jgi:hypothetical protein
LDAIPQLLRKFLENHDILIGRHSIRETYSEFATQQSLSVVSRKGSVMVTKKTAYSLRLFSGFSPGRDSIPKCPEYEENHDIF